MHSPHENINKLYGMKPNSFRNAFNPGATAYTQPLKYVWIITTSSMQTHPLRTSVHTIKYHTCVWLNESPFKIDAKAPLRTGHWELTTCKSVGTVVWASKTEQNNRHNARLNNYITGSNIYVLLTGPSLDGVQIRNSHKTAIKVFRTHNAKMQSSLLTIVQIMCDVISMVTILVRFCLEYIARHHYSVWI